MRAAHLVSVVVVVGLLIGACHKDSSAPAPGGPASTAEADALWKLAPDGAIFGAVVSPRALQMVEHGWTDVHAFLKGIPEFAPFDSALAKALTDNLGNPELSFAAVGMTTTKGGAVFFLPNKKGVMILPVADRDTFLKIAKGKKGDQSDKVTDMTCMTTHGVYACSDEPTIFARLGSGHMSAAAANARGDIEIVGKDLPTGKQPVSFAAVLQLERGAFTLRGGVTGVPSQVLTMMGSTSKPRVESGKTTGFGVLHLKSLLAQLPFPGPLAEFAKSIDDPITMTTRSDSLELQVPLTDTTPAKTLLIEHCTDGPLAQLGAKLVDGGCEFALPNMPNVTAALWLDGKTLHAGQRQVGAGNKTELTGLGKEFADTAWQDAFYGRGSLLGMSAGMGQQMQQMQQMQLPADVMSILRSAMRGLAMINELGIGARLDGDTLRFVVGVRTGWANPDAVVAKLLAIEPNDIIAGKGAELAKPIVEGAKDSPLAGDVQAGYSGLMILTAGTGVLAAVAVPAFMDYMKKSKRSGVSLQLNRIGKNLKALYIETSAFPIGESALLPAGTCCGQPSNKCAADATAFTSDKLWNQIDFQLDEPSQYRFRYHSDDGKTALVDAIGDVDCDGVEATYKLRMSSTDGNASFVIDPPAAGTY